MHRIVDEELERHFSGNASRAFYSHLEGCEACHSEVAAMDEVSALVREMRFDALEEQTAVVPPLGFYSRVTSEIIESQRREAWGLFSPGAAFFRRVAFASLLLLAGLGSFLVTRESSFTGSSGADA